MTALAAHMDFQIERRTSKPAAVFFALRLRPTRLEMLDDATNLDHVPPRRLENGLDRLLRDIENLQEPERWDGMG